MVLGPASVAVAVVAIMGSTAPVAAQLVVNGDFETPSLVGINSDYIHTPQGNVDEGTWWVHPWNPGGPWFSIQHTPGGAGAMSVNGDNSSQAGQKRVWYQTIPVEPGTTYRFSSWALATAAGFPGYSLRFAFDGQQFGGIISPSQAFLWEEFAVEVVALDKDLEISIVNVSGITFPNDFMLDDISLTVAGPAADLDEDGDVDAADLAILLALWGTKGPSGDFNADGGVNAEDLTILLTQWST
jgi:hypothetical protein